MKNIILIGMSGTGKTYLGKKISDRFGLSFVDTDQLLFQKIGDLSKFITDSGEELFLQKQEECLVSLDQQENTVVATGGGAIYNQQAIEHLKQMGVVIWLNDHLNNLVERANVQKKTLIGMRDKSFQELLAERKVLYKKYADIIIDNPSEEKLAEVIKKCFVVQ